MNDKQRMTASKIMQQVIEETFSEEQLQIILHTCMALTWSEETQKIARVGYGLVKEIIHRDCHSWRADEPPKPWENLLSAPAEYLAVRQEQRCEEANLAG